MVHTLFHCGACGWEQAGFETDQDAATAGSEHLDTAHPAMAQTGAGRDQVRLMSYLTLAEFEGAHATDTEPGGAESNEEEPEGEAEEEEEPEAEPKPPRPVPKRAPAHATTKKRRT
jgi:hypothetical protein